MNPEAAQALHHDGGRDRDGNLVTFSERVHA